MTDEGAPIFERGDIVFGGEVWIEDNEPTGAVVKVTLQHAETP